MQEGNPVLLLKLAALKMAAHPMGRAVERMASMAASPTFTSLLRRVPASLALALVGGAGIAGGGKLWHMGADALAHTGKQKAFDQMLREDPELKRMHSSNPKKVRAHFNTLFRFNPEMAKDPLVSSSFVKGTAQQDFLAHKTVGDLIEARAKMRPDKPISLPSLSLLDVQ